MVDPIRYEFESRSLLNEMPQFATTVAHGFDVLRCFTASTPVLGNKEIADALGFSRPTVSRLTFTLVSLGYLSRDEKTQKYCLGPALLSLSYPFLANLSIRWMAEHDLVELSQFASGPVSIGMRDRLQVVYVETVHDKGYNGAKPDIGSTRPLLRTAMGHALLFGHSEAERHRLLGLLADESPEEVEASKRSLDQSFEQISRAGFCVSYGSWRSDLIGIAAPVNYRVGASPLGINITVPAAGADLAWVNETLGPRLSFLVRNLEQRLGVGEP